MQSFTVTCWAANVLDALATIPPAIKPVISLSLTVQLLIFPAKNPAIPPAQAAAAVNVVPMEMMFTESTLQFLISDVSPLPLEIPKMPPLPPAKVPSIVTLSFSGVEGRLETLAVFLTSTPFIITLAPWCVKLTATAVTFVKGVASALKTEPITPPTY